MTQPWLHFDVYGRPQVEETWRWCRACAAVSSGHCWHHATRVYIIPAITIATSETVVPRAV